MTRRKRKSSGRPDERPDGRPDERTDENERPDGRPDGRTNGRPDGRTNGRTYERPERPERPEKRMALADSFLENIQQAVLTAASEGRPVSAQDARLITSVVSSDPTIEAGLIHAVLCSPAFAATPARVTACLLGVAPRLIGALLDPATYAASGNRSLPEKATSMLTHVPEQHRAAVFERIIGSFGDEQAPVVVTIASSVVRHIAAKWNQVPLICDAALDGNTTALAVLLRAVDSAASTASDAASIVDALLARCARAPAAEPVGVGFDRTVDLLVSSPDGSSEPFLFATPTCPLPRIASEAVSGSSSSSSAAAQRLLYAIVARKPDRALTLVIEPIIQSGNTHVLEQVVRHGINEDQMGTALTAACTLLNTDALCLLSRTNASVFTKCALEQHLAHSFVLLGGNLSALSALAELGAVIGQLDVERKPLLETAMRCENWASVTFICGYHCTASPDKDTVDHARLIDSMRRRRPLTKPSITPEAARALIGLFAVSTSSLRSASLRSAADSSLRSAADSSLRSVATLMEAIGLSAYVMRTHELDTLRYAASKLTGLTGLSDSTGLSGLSDSTGLSGLSGLSGLVITGALVEEAVKRQLFNLASQLVDLLAAEGAVNRIVSKYEILASAPRSLFEKVYTRIQAEGAPSLDYARALSEHLRRVVEFTRTAARPGSSSSSSSSSIEQDVVAAHESAVARVAQLEREVSLQPAIEQVATSIARQIRRFDQPPTINRLVDLLYLGNPAASIARVYADTNSAFFFTAFTDSRIWKYAVAARRYKDLGLSAGAAGLIGLSAGPNGALVEAMFAQWLRYRQHVYDSHESPIASAATFEGDAVSRASLADKARAMPALQRIARFLIQNDYPHPQFCTGVLGSEAPGATDGAATEGAATDGAATDGAAPAAAVLVERDTATGQGAQSDLAFTLFRACTGATTVTSIGGFTGTTLALFDQYPTGLVPRPDADKDTLRLLGWTLGFMFAHNVPTGNPRIAPAISAMLLGISVPNFTDALLDGKAAAVPADLSCDVEMALSFIGPTALYGTSERIAAVSEQFKALVGTDTVTVATFGDLVRVAQPLFLELLGDAIDAIATGFRASIAGSSSSVPAAREANIVRSCAAIFGTPCDVSSLFGADRREDTFATESDLARIGAFTAGACSIDVAEIRARTRYNTALSNDHPAVAAFWAALGLLASAELEEFYIFWTSAPPPRTGSASLEYTITGKADAPRDLITSHTCFNGIDISTALDSVEAASACIKSTLEHDRRSRSMHH